MSVAADLPERDPAPAGTSVTVYTPPAASEPGAASGPDAIDCRALIDLVISPRDWCVIFLALRDAKTVPASGLLLRYRFGPHAVLERDPSASISSVATAPGKEEVEHDVESAPRSAEKVL